MMRGLLLAITLLLAASGTFAEDSPRLPEQDPVTEANALYRDGEFAAAAAGYRDALAAGLDGPRVHFNLGNALFRSGERGEAIAHYLAALRLAPRDEDIRANLDHALAERTAGRPAPPASWLHAVASGVVGRFTLSEFAAAAAVGWWGALAAFAALLVGAGRRRTMRRLAILLGVLTIALTSLAGARWWSWHQVERAVIAAESEQLRTGPGESFESILAVDEGWLLRVLRQDAGWAEVAGEGGATGWLPASSLVTVPPEAGESTLPEDRHGASLTD